MTRLSLLSLAVAVAGCGAAGGSETKRSGSPTASSGGASYGDRGAGGAAGAAGVAVNVDAAPLAPEKEQNVSFLTPRAGARYVYVANPVRNRVSIIDSETLAITEAWPGDTPTYVATIPGQDLALVINTGSPTTLSILHGNGKVDGGMSDPIPIVARANAIAVSPDGRHAVIWFDAAQAASSTSASSTSASTNQEVSVVDLTGGTVRVVAMTVGYTPSQVVFSNDNTAAFVVADNGISKLRFADIRTPDIAPFTPFGSTSTGLVRRDAGTPDVGSPASSESGLDGGASPEAGALDGGAASRDLAADLGSASPKDVAPPPVNTSSSNAKVVDVSVTPNGSYAIARREGTAELLLIDLVNDAVTSLVLASPVTDLDLMPSGSEAFAVLRDQNTLVRIEIPAGFVDETRRTPWPLDVLIGSVTMSTEGRYALLYSTAAPTGNLVILDLAHDSYRVVEVPRKVRAVAVAPDEKTALVLHPAPATGGTSSAKDKAFGYTMVRLADGFARWQDTEADPNPFAITPSSSDVFVLLRDDKASVRKAQRMSLGSFTITDYLLGSPPRSIGALSGKSKVFVEQDHPEGRITFIDWQTGGVESVTGFALSARIRQ
jgi:hypothetical protein